MAGPIILLRCDISPHLGSGHFSRCRTLAAAVTKLGGEVAWRIGSLHQEMIKGKLAPDASVTWCAPDEPLADTLRSYTAMNGAVLVLDHYQLAVEMDAEAPASWFRFDAGIRNETTGARWIHNALPGVPAETYSSRVIHPEATLLLGPKYALVRPEFAQGPARIEKEEVRSILLTFGGGDDRGATLSVLEILEPVFPRVRFEILCTSATRSLKALQQKASDRIKIHLNAVDVAAIMASTDMAICAGGTTLNELACLGVPGLIVTIVANQEKPAAEWSKAGAFRVAGSLDRLQAEELQSAVQAMQDPSVRRSMAETGKRLVDGLGAERTARFILGKEIVS